MRKVSILFSIILVISIILIYTSSQKDNEHKKWRYGNKFSYPIQSEDNEWLNLSNSQRIEACNMPNDLIGECSTDELADLLLEYPFLIDVLAFSTAEQAILHLRNTSNIFRNYSSRDDAIDVLLKKYSELEVDYDTTGDSNSGLVKKRFLQIYFSYKADSMNKEQKRMLDDIIASEYKSIIQDDPCELEEYDLDTK